MRCNVLLSEVNLNGTDYPSITQPSILSAPYIGAKLTIKDITLTNTKMLSQHLFTVAAQTIVIENIEISDTQFGPYSLINIIKCSELLITKISLTECTHTSSNSKYIIDLHSFASTTLTSEISSVTLTSAHFPLFKLRTAAASESKLTLNTVVSTGNTYPQPFIHVEPMVNPQFVISVNRTTFTNDIFTTACMLFEARLGYVVIDVVRATNIKGAMYVFKAIDYIGEKKLFQTAEIGNSTYINATGKILNHDLTFYS